jgi:hypothetical protein
MHTRLVPWTLQLFGVPVGAAVRLSNSANSVILTGSPWVDEARVTRAPFSRRRASRPRSCPCLPLKGDADRTMPGDHLALRESV